MGINEIVQIGTRLKQLRVQKGYKQKELAKKAGISYTTYSNYENNNREPNKNQLEKIANALEIKVADLMGISAYLDDVEQSIHETTSFKDYLGVLGYKVSESPHDDKWVIHIKESDADIYINSEEMSLLESTTKENIDLRMSKYFNDGKHNQ